MNPILSWLDQMTSIWSAFVFHSVWQSALVGAVMLGAVYLGRRWPAPLRYSLLLLALAKFAVPPLWPVSPGLFGIAGPTVKVSTPARMVSAESPTAHQETGENVSGQAATRIQEINLSPGLSTDLRSGTTPPFALSWKTWLMLLHVTGTGVILVWIAGQLVRLQLLAKLAQPLRNEGLVQKWAALAERMRMKRLPRLMVVSQSHSPMAFGVFHPAILLPQTLPERLSPAEVETILGHELAHIRRRDLWVNWLQLLLLAVWWFHPVLWLVNRSLRRIREDCCDDLVLAHGIANAPDYCAVLVRAARTLASAAPVASPLGCAEKFHPLGRRVSRLMDGRIPRWPSLPATSLGGVIVLALLVLPGLRSQETSPTPAARFGRAMADNTNATPVRLSHLVEIKVEHPSPEQAVNIFSNLAHRFVEVDPERPTRLNNITVEGSEKVEYQALSAAMKDYVSAEGRAAMARKVQERVQALLKSGTRPESIPQVRTEKVVQELTATLAMKEAELAEKLEQYGAKHPDVLKLTEHIQNLRKSLSNECDRIIQAMVNEADLAKAQEDALAVQKERIEQRLLGMGAVSYQIRRIYDQAWICPEAVIDESLKVQAVVVIGRDGQVLSAKITQPSGNHDLDKSVENVLNKVHQVPRPPELVTEDRLEYKITFSLKTKKSR